MFPDTNLFLHLSQLDAFPFTFSHSCLPIYLPTPLYYFPLPRSTRDNLYLPSFLPIFLISSTHFPLLISSSITSLFYINLASSSRIKLNNRYFYSLTLTYPCTDTLFTCVTPTLFVFTVPYAHFTLPTRREGCETTSFTIEILTDLDSSLTKHKHCRHTIPNNIQY